MTRLVDELRAYVQDERVLAAMAAVPRDVFVPRRARGKAWRNEALPIGSGQTISQPLVVARMCELLDLHGDERVLDVGTGSGYHAAVLAQLAAHVHSVERHARLSERAAAALSLAGIENVTLAVGDATQEAGSYDRINVAAACDLDALDPLVARLAPGGLLIAPVETGEDDQQLTVLRLDEDGGLSLERHERVKFVPLITN